ncbi:histidine kinase [Gorillibacterium massiliense]|uniref:histidine kinase n=1 Tax=Gorillibacterium massiliense TaxID=1280390 RepID=UPI0004ACF135|nr:histidine kinase [Gorillibacterium massiliense]
MKTALGKAISFTGFMIGNGILTISTTLLIVLTIKATLGGKEDTWRSYTPMFFFVLVITTLFFFLIYLQGRRLRSEQEQLANVFMHSSEGVLILDNEKTILRINPAAQRIMKSGSDTEPANFCEVCSNYPGLGKLCTYQNCFVYENTTEPVELQLVTPRNETVSVRTSVSRYEDPLHGPLSVLRIKEVEEKRQEEQHQIAKMITHSILSAQEDERKRISRELHDGIGQSLYSILIQTEMLKDTADEERVEALQEAIRNTIEDIRDLSAELRPSALDDIGLVAALRNYFRSYGQKFGIQVHFMVEGDAGRIPSAQETAFYRIVQEALTNAAKYAHTDVVDVQLKLSPLYAELLIQDYGCGFVITSELRQGVGLYSMEERVKILRGWFDMNSLPGKGTTIRAKVPIMEGTSDQPKEGK